MYFSCDWKLHFSDTILNVKSDRLYNIPPAGWNLRKNSMSKIEYFESNGHKFSHISEMLFCFYNRSNEYHIRPLQKNIKSNDRMDYYLKN